ncbi:UDP-glucuronosyl/UDP-glucosyltransferase [Macleaya cordata]|uniref:UDP-glucuronosyl/UDP-glucosyltransferase n=1 Tax=Macleaya cordata TaxID=56857 RepID=A0A200QJN6_MACCD|nr:UDP-glucuronosyl/UDP-glucosyltransferase [Macleaya cordata]
MGEEEIHTWRSHVLVLPFPVQSHINPMIQFSKRLASKGLKVTLATTIFISKSMQAEAGPVRIESFSDVYDEGGVKEGGSKNDRIELFKDVGSKYLQELIEKQNRSGYPFKCLLYDSVILWALDIAKKFGLIGAAFYTQSCSVNAIYYNVQKGLLSTPIEGPTISVPGLPLLETHELPSFVYKIDSYPCILSLVLNQFSNIQEADWHFLNTFDKLEDEVVNWMAKQSPTRMIAIGPTVPSMYLDKRVEGDNDYGLHLFTPNSETCMKWLDTKEVGSVVYVSFGSLASLGEDQMEEIAWGLRRSNFYFLWVVRASEENKLPSNFVEEISEKGLVVRWCRQLEVLAHQAVGCFVTHCGWNSTLEGLSLGVPMVAMQQWVDQTTNAKFIEDVWRVGVRAKVDEKGMVRREEVEVCIREVMEGERREEIKRNAVRWKGLAKEAVDEGGSSDTNIEEFVARVLCI